MRSRGSKLREERPENLTQGSQLLVLNFYPSFVAFSDGNVFLKGASGFPALLKRQAFKKIFNYLKNTETLKLAEYIERTEGRAARVQSNRCKLYGSRNVQISRLIEEEVAISGVCSG